MDDNQHTPALDLFGPTNRFASASRFTVRLHRWQLVFRRSWWMLLLTAVTVVLPVCWFSACLGPLYEARARLWLVGKLNIPEDRFYTEELLNYLGTQTELLRSPMIQQRALQNVERQIPVRRSQEQRGGAGWKDRWRAQGQQTIAWLGRLLGASSSQPSNAVPPIPFKVVITESSKSSILELRVRGSDPHATQLFLDSLMHQYLEYKKELRAKTTDRAVVSMSEQVQQLAEEVRAQQYKVHTFQSSNNMLLLQEQGNSAAAYLAALNKQLASARMELQLLQLVQPEQWLETAAPKTAADSGPSLPEEKRVPNLPATLAGPQAELFKATQQRQVLKSKRTELAQFLRPTHPKILKLDQEIATQEQLVQTSKDESARQLEARRQALELQIRNLESACTEWNLKAIEASGKMADYDSLRQELQRLQETYQRLLGVIQTADLSKALEAENIGILEPASVAKPVPRLLWNLLFALAASLVFGMGLLLLRNALDDRLDCPLEIRAHFHEPLVGLVPNISLKRIRNELDLESLEDQQFDFLESFRNLRSSLYFMGNGTGRPRTILITSSVPREGKSTVALYLAATMAMGGSRVLLIDADMRRGSLHTVFGIPTSPGLAELLSQDLPAGNVIVPTKWRNLSFLPAGAAARSPGELVLSSRWSALLAEISPNFDFVLIDSPPLLATDDAASLAQRVDGALLVVRGAFTSARDAHDALDALHHRHVKVLGLVFNRATFSAYYKPHYHSYRKHYNWKPKCDKQLAALPNS